MAKKFSWIVQDLQDFKTLVNQESASVYIRPLELESITPPGLLHMLESIQRPRPRTYNERNAIAPIEKLIGNADLLGEQLNDRYRRYLSLIRKNSYSKWLFSDVNFLTAYNQFVKKQGLRTGSRYRQEWAELRFLDVCSVIGDFVLKRQAGYRRRDPTTRQLKQGHRRAIDLKQSLQNGVYLDRIDSTKRLHDLLDELIESTSYKIEKGYRKRRTDANSNGRECVGWLATMLLVAFNEASPEIIINLSRVVSYDADDSAIREQIARVREYFKQSKIDAELKISKKTA